MFSGGRREVSPRGTGRNPRPLAPLARGAGFRSAKTAPSTLTGAPPLRARPSRRRKEVMRQRKDPARPRSDPLRRRVDPFRWRRRSFRRRVGPFRWRSGSLCRRVGPLRQRAGPFCWRKRSFRRRVEAMRRPANFATCVLASVCERRPHFSRSKPNRPCPDSCSGARAGSRPGQAVEPVRQPSVQRHSHGECSAWIRLSRAERLPAPKR